MIKRHGLDLRDYIISFKNIIPTDVCNSVIETLQEENIWQKHVWSSYTRGEHIFEEGVYSDDLSMSNGGIHNENTKFIMDITYQVIKEYVNIVNIPGFNSWAGFTNPTYHRYQVGQAMHKHIDSITSIFDGERKGVPTLSIVGTFNNNYTGGEFIMFDDTPVDISTGDIIVFPSSFLYPHTVTNITKGTRYSFVSWVW